jgi:hypothetical protein
MKEKKKHRIGSEVTIKIVRMEGGRRLTGIPTIFRKFFSTLSNCLLVRYHYLITSCNQNNGTGEDLEDDVNGILKCTGFGTEKCTTLLLN